MWASPGRSRAAQIEAQVLESEGLRPESWLSHVKGLDLDGSRRPLRVPVADPEAEWVDGEGLWLRFGLPAGSFATTLLDQVMGPDAANKETPGIDPDSGGSPIETPEGLSDEN